MSDEKSLNVVQLFPGSNSDEVLAHLDSFLKENKPESFMVVGIGRHQGMSVSFYRAEYDPVRLLGALDLAARATAEIAEEMLTIAGGPDGSMG